MDSGIEECRPRTPLRKGRRGRPARAVRAVRAVRVEVEYRPQSSEEEQNLNDALRLVLASMVRRRLGMNKENENEY